MTSVPAVPGSPATPSKPPAGNAPPATASSYVYAPQQVTSRPGDPSPWVTKRANVPVVPSGSDSADAGPPRNDGTAPPGTPGELLLFVVPSATDIAKGNILIVDVMASSSTPVLDAPLHLSFDPEVISYLDGSPGDFLTQGGSSVVFLADAQSRPGDLAIALGRVVREQGAVGSGLLCRVRFRGVVVGTTAVNVGQAKAWDTSGEPLIVRSVGTTVAVR